jgi:CIC family chloride channel protein
LLRGLEGDATGKLTVLEAGSNEPVVAYEDELAHDAMFRMLQHNIGRLPVVGREDPRHMVGYFNRASILEAWSKQMHEEGVREHGWLRTWRNPKDSGIV